jgi:hypothetical protein
MSSRHGLLMRATSAAAAAVFVVGAGLTLAEDEGESLHPVEFTHNGMQAPVAGAVFGTQGTVKPGRAICTTTTSNAANVNTDCERAPGPHNETAIAVNPTDHNNIIGGANDYQLGLNPGGHVTQSTLSRAHVSFDAGHTWSMFPIHSNYAYQGTGDPSIAFDADGRAYYATLGFRFVGPFNATNPDIVVATSNDKGRNWTSRRVASGSGSALSVGHLLDKEWVTAWGHGNAIVTYGDFRLGQHGSYVSAKIYSVVTHNGGQTWSAPQQISGSLHDSFVSVPTVTSDGRIFVSFMNTDDLTTGRDTYYVSEVNSVTGARSDGPFRVSLVIDGATDYPIAEGRQTYQDSMFRTWAAGNITADPTNPAHLAVVWSDMRNSPTPADPDPYEAVTNSDVIVSQSTDYGRTWSAATAVALANDQFMPWGAFDSAGTLRIGTFDRSTDAANHRYDYSLLTQTGPATYGRNVVTTQQSNPTRNQRWFARTEDEDFPNATAFLGDYSNIAIVPGTTDVVAYWTDLREMVTFAGATRHGQDAYFAYIP